MWDSKGNLTTDPSTAKTYGYSSENLLTSASGGVTLGYDPQKRLYQVAGAATTRFAYDGVKPIAEYDGSNALLRRYVFGNGHDDPIVQYEGTGTTDRRFMSRDEKGSVISLTDSAGALIGIDRYDEYGRPQSSNIGRFQYTGQMWLSEVGAYHYKARAYLPHLGVFAQTDPAGYDPSPNLYAYANNDPVNGVDPSGEAVTYYCEGGVYTQAQANTPDAHGILPDLENCAAVPVATAPSGPTLIPTNPALTGPEVISGTLATITTFSTETYGSETLVRTWVPIDLFGTGMVVQRVTSVVAYPNAEISVNSFYESWAQVNGNWIYGANTDTFGIAPGYPGTSLQVSAEAYYYPGVVYNPNWGIGSVLVPGGVGQAGGLPSCYCQTNPMLGRPAWGPVSVTYSTSYR